MPALYFYKDFEGAPEGVVDLPDNPQSSYAKWTIGRHSDNNVVILDKRISRYAAILVRRLVRTQRGYTDFYTIEDLANHNGTWLNGEKLAPNDPTPIKPMDKLCFGWIDAKAVFLNSVDDTLNEAIWEQPGWPENDDLLMFALTREGVTLSGTVSGAIDPVAVTPSEPVEKINNGWEFAGMVSSKYWATLAESPPWFRYSLLALGTGMLLIIFYEWVKR